MPVEELNKILNYIIENGEIKTSELRALGYSKYRISKLAENKDSLLIREKIGHYTLNPNHLTDLIFYSVNLHLEKRKKALTCIKSITEKNPDISIREIFLTYLKKRKYKNAAEVFSIFDISSLSPYDYLYLFLLSHITILPDNLKSIAKSINSIDIQNKEENESDEIRILEEEIRSYVLGKNFYEASQHLKKKINIQGTTKVEDTILSNLILYARVHLSNEKKQVLAFINEKQYENALEILKEREAQRELDILEIYTIYLLETLLNIQKTRVIPTSKNSSNKNLFSEIDNNNFNEALELARHDIIFLLLTEIINEIEEIKKEERKNPIIEAGIDDILKFLSIKNIPTSFKLLNYYLRKINKQEYLRVITDLIEISYMVNEIGFTTPIRALIDLKNGKWEIKPEIYVEALYDAANCLEIEEAKLYLKLLIDLQALNLADIDVEKLKRVIAEAEGKTFDPYNMNHLKKIYNLMLNGLNIDEACFESGLDEDKQNIVYLMFAKQYYYISDFPSGDILVSLVEKNKNKSEEVKRLLVEVRRDRKFYPHRTDEKNASLILTQNI